MLLQSAIRCHARDVSPDDTVVIGQRMSESGPAAALVDQNASVETSTAAAWSTCRTTRALLAGRSLAAAGSTISPLIQEGLTKLSRECTLGRIRRCLFRCECELAGWHLWAGMMRHSAVES